MNFQTNINKNPLTCFEGINAYNNKINLKGKTICVWFSCGAASAVAAKIIVDVFGKDNNVIIVNTPVANEHPDNQRFLKDVEKWIGVPIQSATNKDFPNSDIREVFEKRKYMSGIAGAPCTLLLKKEARYQFEKRVNIDFHVLGFTVEEWKRQKNFDLGERDNTIPILIYELLTKDDCFRILRKAGIELPYIYSLDFPNANCIGCVKSQSPTYWNLVRKHFPEIFNERAEQSKRLGVRLVKYKGKRIFLDELTEDMKGGKIKSWDCGIFCKL